ncbi:MAG: hypothetical protein EBU59_01445 [Planctomycetia bacterium]|nr:hypothetical protein [Planctomycetia bacterium]
MTTPSHSESATPLRAPSGQQVVDLLTIRRFLDRVRQRARRWIWVETAAQFGLVTALWFWATLLLDWLIEPPPGIRLLAALVLVVWLLGLVSFRLVSRLRTRLRDEPLALLVERTHPEMADSLSTAVELNSRQADPAFPVDGDLLARTTSAAAAAVNRVSISQLFKRRRLLRLAGLSGFAIGTVVAVLVLVPELREIWWRRLVQLDEAAWPRRVTLAVTDFPEGIRRVARGSDVEILVTATAEGDLPTVVELRSRGGDGWATVRMGTRGGRQNKSQTFGHTLRDVSEDLDLEIRGGDARLRGLTIIAVEPPTLASLELTVTPPSYIGGAARPLPATRLVEVPAAATVTLTATASKPLSQAVIRKLPAADAEPESAAKVIATLNTSQPADRTTDQEGRGGSDTVRQVTGTVTEVLTDCTLDISFTDTTGISNQQPIRFQLLARPDEPPPVVGTMEDDHGLNTAAIQIRRLPRGETEAAVTSHPIAVAESSPVATLTPAKPASIAVATVAATVGDRLELTVTAEDRCGLASGPQVSRTDPWSLQVVPPEKLLAMLEAREIILRRRFESLLADFQQTRDRLAANRPGEPGESAPSPPALMASRLAEAANRASGETTEIAQAFREIAHELANNSLLTAELEGRLVRQIAAPLEGIVSGAIRQLTAACRSARTAAPTPPAELLTLTDTCLDQLRAVLDRMIELETFNEVVDSLRKLIEQQEAIQQETERQRKQRARDVLQGL